MPGTAKIIPSGRQFVVHSGETILESALRAGLALQYGCANGTCGDCKARVVSGTVEDARFHDYTIGAAEKSRGYVLLCSTTALSDVVLEAAEAHDATDIPRQSMRTRIHRLDRIGNEVMILHLKVLRGRALRFLAGQHATLDVDGVPSARLPIASCPCDGLNLQFHVPEVTSDAFSDYIFGAAKKSDKIELEGPWGNFNLDESSPRTLVFIAHGTGFAPIQSLIEHAINLDLEQPMRLYWHAAQTGGHYLHNYCRSWADALDDFRYVSQSGPLSQICAKVLEGHPDLSDVDVYLAGPEAFTSPVAKLLGEHGLPGERRFVDAIDGTST